MRGFQLDECVAKKVAEGGGVLSTEFAQEMQNQWPVAGGQLPVVESEDIAGEKKAFNFFSNSSGAVLIAPQWSAPGTSQRIVVGLRT